MSFLARKKTNNDEIEKWLKSIKGTLCFRERMKVYAPTCNNRCNDAVEELIVSMNKLFGGSTVYDAHGSWVDKGLLVVDPVKVIEVGHSCVDKESAKKFAEAVSTYATRANQKAISVSQGNFYLADTPQIVEAFRERFRKKWR